MEKEIFQLNEKEQRLEFANGQWKIKESHESSGYGVRVLKNKKLGFAFGKDRDSLFKSAEDASQFSPATVFSFAKPEKYETVTIFDSSIIDRDADYWKEKIDSALGGMEKNARSYLSAGEALTNLENSNGIDAEYKKTFVRFYIEINNGNGFGFSHYASNSQPKKWEEFGENAAEMAKSMINAKTPASGSYSVVFSVEALSDILEVFLPALSGDWERRKISPLLGQTDKKITDEKISLFHDPLSGEEGSRPFDDEGTPSKRVAIIENGVLKRFLYDRETLSLKISNLKTSDIKTGNKAYDVIDNTDKATAGGFCFRRDFSSAPSIAPAHISIAGGECKNITQEVDNYLEVHSLHGTHTANTTTGDFGVEVNVAWHINKDGKIPIRGFIISSNVFSLLKSIGAMEKKVSTSGNLTAPLIEFKKLSVIS